MCEEIAILATPLTGSLGGRLVQLPVDGDIIIAGLGRKLKTKVRAVWTSQVALHDDVVYARSLSFGVVEVPVPSLKRLAELFGSGFVRVEQGIVVALAACLVPDFPGRMVGLSVGFGAGREPVIEWVICSKRGMQELRSRFPLVPS